MPDRIVRPIGLPRDDGVYAARVSMKVPGGAWVSKKSSFFPDFWPPQKVKEAIEQAFADREVLEEGRRWRGASHGLVIDGSFHRNGSWDSAWPFIEDEM
jgi:hypothetical protein